MFGFLGGSKKPLKGYKVTGIDRKNKYGIAANSLHMLKDKASAKLKVSMVCVGASIFNQHSFYLWHFLFRSRIVVCIWPEMVLKLKMKHISRQLNRRLCS